MPLNERALEDAARAMLPYVFKDNLHSDEDRTAVATSIARAAVTAYLEATGKDT